MITFSKVVLSVLLVLALSPLFGQNFIPINHQIDWGSDPISSGVSVTSNFRQATDSLLTLTFSGAVWSGGQRVYLMLGDKVLSKVVLRGLIGEFQNLPQTAIRLEVTPLNWLELWGWYFVSWGHLDGPSSGFYYLYSSIMSFCYLDELLPMGKAHKLTLAASFQQGQALPEDTYTIGIQYNRSISKNDKYEVFCVATYDATVEEMLYKMGFKLNL